jgi:hypothetical protein
MTSGKPFGIIRAALMATLALTATTLIASSRPGAQGPDKIVPTVTVSALEALLPAPTGWTKLSSRSKEITISPECRYAFADVLLTKDEMRVRVTLADTGFGPESLMALAAMVVTLPNGYSEEVTTATTIRRFDYAESPAAERFDAAGGEGEIVVVVAGRFIARVEGQHVDTTETLSGVLQQVDLKRLGALK